MVNLVFGVAWWVYLAAALVGVAVFWWGNKRQAMPLRNAGAALALLAVVVLVASFFVETDKQKCLRQSREAARDIQNQNWPQLTTLLDPHVSLSVATGSLYTNRDDLLKGVADGVQQYGLKDVTIISTSVNQTQTVITVDMDILTTQDATMGRPIRSSWQLEWQENGRHWLLYSITCQQIGDISEDEMRRVFPR